MRITSGGKLAEKIFHATFKLLLKKSVFKVFFQLDHAAGILKKHEGKTQNLWYTAVRDWRIPEESQMHK